MKAVEYYRTGRPDAEMIRKEELLVDLCDALKTLVSEFEASLSDYMIIDGGPELWALKRAKTVLRRAELNR